MFAKCKTDDFTQIVEGLKAELKNLKPPESNGSQGDEWLRTMYAKYTDRFLADNNRIWTTASIMIPVSLAAFAALPTISCPKSYHLLILAAASSAIMISWLIIAENHRSFQEKSRAWIVAIEQIIGLENTGPQKIRDNWRNRSATFPGAVQWMRWVLTAAVLIGWGTVLGWWPRC